MASKIRKPKAGIVPTPPLAPEAPVPTPAPRAQGPRRIVKKPVAIAEPTSVSAPEPTPIPAPRNNTEFFGPDFDSRIAKMVAASAENLGLNPSPKQTNRLIDTGVQAFTQTLDKHYPNISSEERQREIDKQRAVITKQVATLVPSAMASEPVSPEESPIPTAEPEMAPEMEPEAPAPSPIMEPEAPAPDNTIAPVTRDRLQALAGIEPSAPEPQTNLFGEPSQQPSVGASPELPPDAPVTDPSQISIDFKTQMQKRAGIEPTTPVPSAEPQMVPIEPTSAPIVEPDLSVIDHEPVAPTPTAAPVPTTTTVRPPSQGHPNPAKTTAGTAPIAPQSVPSAPVTPTPAPAEPSMDTSIDEPKRLIPKPEAPAPDAPEDGPKRLIPKGTISGKPTVKQAWQTPQAHTPQRKFGLGDKLRAGMSAFKDPGSVGSSQSSTARKFAPHWKELQELLEKEGIDGQTLTLEEWSQVLNETSIGKELFEAGFWKPFNQPEKFTYGGVARTKDDGSQKMNRPRRFRTTPKSAEAEKLAGVQSADAMQFKAPAFAIDDVDPAVRERAKTDAMLFARQIAKLGAKYDPNTRQITIPKSNATGVAALQQMKLPVTQDQEFGRSGTYRHQSFADDTDRSAAPGITGQPTPAGNVSPEQRLDIKQLLALRDIRKKDAEAKAIARAQKQFNTWDSVSRTQSDTENPTLPRLPEPPAGSDDFQVATPMPSIGGRTTRRAASIDEPDAQDMDMSAAMDTSQSAMDDSDRIAKLRAKKAARLQAKPAVPSTQTTDVSEDRYTLEEWKSMLEEAGYSNNTSPLVDETPVKSTIVSENVTQLDRLQRLAGIKPLHD